MQPLARPKAPAGRHGFSVIEVLLAVAIMTVIIIGLYTVFDQTQKALRGTVSQVDVLESVRAASDLVGRELEGATSFPIPRYTNLYIARNRITQGVGLKGLDEKKDILNTVIQDVFFHTRVGDRYGAIGYWVGPLRTNETAPISVGRLYRFATNVTEIQIQEMAGKVQRGEDRSRNRLLEAFNSLQRFAHSSPVIEGVVHFRVIAYTPEGYPLFPIDTGRTSSGETFLQMLGDEYEARTSDGRLLPFPQTYFAALQEQPEPPLSVRCLFSDHSYPEAPTELELELGIIEPQLVNRYTSIPDPAEARRFLARHSGQVHLFRQRIPLRNSPPF